MLSAYCANHEAAKVILILVFKNIMDYRYILDINPKYYQPLFVSEAHSSPRSTAQREKRHRSPSYWLCNMR